VGFDLRHRSRHLGSDDPNPFRRSEYASAATIDFHLAEERSDESNGKRGSNDRE
jgi:hypothetical protein